MAESRVKICGITRREDALAALNSGGDYLGAIIEFPRSPRSVTVNEACSVFSELAGRMVAVTVNQSTGRLESLTKALKPHALQLHGDESVEQIRELAAVVETPIWKTLHLPPADGDHRKDSNQDLMAEATTFLNVGVSAIVLDATVRDGSMKVYGGTGRNVDWSLAARFVEECRIPVILAGGLTSENVREAVQTVRPFAVDVSSGVESTPGIKDVKKVESFIREARSAWSDGELK